MPGWTSWVLADQSKIDECAEALMSAGFYNTVKRGHDTAQPPNLVRSMQIDMPGDDLNPKAAELGQAVVMMGDVILVFTAEQYADSPFYEEP